MKNSILLSICVLFMAITDARATEITANISSSTTWTVANSPYIIKSNINVIADATLTIESGVVVKFDAGRYLQVRGTLNATGVSFTANDGVTKGFWDGIYVSYSSYEVANVNLTNCTVEYAKSIYVRKGQLTLSNCLVDNLQNTIEIHDLGTLNIDNTTISNVNFPITYKGTGDLNIGDNITLTDNTYDYIDIDFSSISQVLHLKDYGLTYYSDNYLTVNGTGTLQIDPGVNYLSHNTGIQVNGKINAVGTHEKPITFDRAPSAVYWQGINILNSSVESTCVIKNSVFRNTTHDQYSGEFIALRIENASPTIDSCRFEGNAYNLRIKGNSQPLISNCVFGESTNTGSDVYNVAMDLSASPTFTNDSIKFNSTEIRAVGLNGVTVKNHNRLKKIDFIGLNNISYYLNGATTVHDTASLVIDPGIVIKFNNYSSSIRGDGVLTGIGTEAEPIIFTHIADDNYGNPLDSQNDGTKSISQSAGGRIYLYSNAESKLENWKIINAGSGSDWAIHVKNNNIINKCEINNSINGIWFTNDAQITNNSFANINTFPVGYTLTNGTPNLQGNTVSDGYLGIKLVDVENTSLTLKKVDFGGYTNIPYILDNNITIAAGNIFTINPGIIIKSTGSNARLTVNGALTAAGTKNEKIIFTSIKDDSAGGDTNNDGTGSVAGNDWGGIKFNNSSNDADNILRNVEVRYTYTYSNDNSAVSISNCSVLMDSVKINFTSNHAIGIFGTANPEIKDCDLFNIAFEPLYMNMFANPIFSGDNKLANCGRIAIKLRSGIINGTVPKRNFAGYNTITYVNNDVLTITNQLTIPAGITFKGSGHWEIKGKLDIEGTAENPVVFTSIEDDNYGNPLDTQSNGVKSPSNNGNYFVFEASALDSSSIDNTIFRYSANIPIQLNNTSPTIKNTTFENIIYEGLSLFGSSTPAIKNCTFNNVKYPFETSILTYPRSTAGNTIVGSTGRGIRIRNETLTQDATLMKRDFAGIQNIPYVLGAYTVGTAAKLTIEPGVIAKFERNGNLMVQNGLIAQGGSTTDSTIVFTSIYDDFYGGDTFNDGTTNLPGNTSWYGIYFSNESIDEDCKLNHCIIKYASNSYYYNPNGAVTIDNASPSITNTRIEGGYYGILSLNTSMPVISDCDFLDNYSYALWNKNESNTITASNCWFNSDTGTTHSSNPDGKGSKVSDYVAFTPFKGELGKAELGDVSLNGTTSPYDASLILQHTVSNITLSQTQQNVADVSGNGTISSYDASLILQYNVDLIANFGQNTNLAPRKMQAMAAPPSIAFTSLQASPGTDEFVIPIAMNTTQGIKSLDMKFDFNPSHIQLKNISTSNINKDILIAQSDNTENGKLAVSLTSAYDLSLDNGMIYLTYKLMNSTIESSEFDINSVMANENSVTVENPTLTIPSRVISDLRSTFIDNQLHAWVNNNSLVVRFGGDTQFKKVSFKLLDISSRILVSNEYSEMDNSNNQIQIPLSELGSPQNGVYLIQLTMDGRSYSKKIVINKQ